MGQYEKTMRLLEADPFHPALRLHRLKGRLSALHAVSINIRYRISLLLEIREKTVIPVDVGSHDDVYR
jgi:mRNA-degrading endonuclease YafQ of YafQ-DinJ toxin-antitoxin module